MAVLALRSERSDEVTPGLLRLAATLLEHMPLRKLLMQSSGCSPTTRPLPPFSSLEGLALLLLHQVLRLTAEYRAPAPGTPNCALAACSHSAIHWLEAFW